MSIRRCVIILGDTLGTPHCGVPEGEGYANILARELQNHDVQVLNWSREDQTAMGWATESLEELQNKLREAGAGGSEMFVLIELGMQDRVFMPEMVEEALGMLVRVVTSMDARPIIMEVVPDNIDGKVAQELGAGFVPATELVVLQYAEKEGGAPFMPRSEAHQDMAEAAMAALIPELRLVPVGQGGRSPGRGSGSRAGPFDGIWYHKNLRGLHEAIEGNTIISSDGEQTRLVPISNDTFYIEQEGQRIQARLNGKEIQWDDGDIWCLNEKGPTGSLDQLKDAWETAERAAASTRQAVDRNELKSERRNMDEERQRLDRDRAKLEQDMRRVGAM